MPWTTPTLKDTRKWTRDYVLSQLGAKAMIPNSVLRIMSDAMSGLTHLTLLYLDWLAKQLMPDTAETEWLDRHGQIWLTNSDGTKGRKGATYAHGKLQYEGIEGTTVPIGTIAIGANDVNYQSITEALIGENGLGDAEVIALSPGTVGNLPNGTVLGGTIEGVNIISCLGDMLGGADEETDEQLRERVLFRIQNPPMGGSEADYVRWAMAVPGVTRAWAAVEQGMGTITVRFLMDDTYPDNYGLPTMADLMTVSAYVDKMRPVTVKDCYVVAPLLEFYNINIVNLTQDTPTVRAQIEQSIKEMEMAKSQPGQTMYRSWVDEAISAATGEETHELIFETKYMPAPGYMPVLGSVYYNG